MLQAGCDVDRKLKFVEEDVQLAGSRIRQLISKVGLRGDQARAGSKQHLLRLDVTHLSQFEFESVFVIALRQHVDDLSLARLNLAHIVDLFDDLDAIDAEGAHRERVIVGEGGDISQIHPDLLCLIRNREVCFRLSLDLALEVQVVRCVRHELY